MSEKYDALTSGMPYEAHNNELDEIESFVSDIGESMISETISTSSSRRSTRSTRPSTSSKNSSHSSRPSTSRETSRRGTIPSQPLNPQQNLRHRNTSNPQEVIRNLEVQDPPPNRSLSIGSHDSYNQIQDESLSPKERKQPTQLSSTNLPTSNNNLPSGSSLPTLGEENKSRLSVISSLTTSRSQDEGQPGWANEDYVEVRNSNKLLVLDPESNSNSRVTSIFSPRENPIGIPTNATLNRAFPANLISTQLSQKLGLDIEYFPDDDDDITTEVQVGKDGQWKELVVGVVRFMWKGEEEPNLDVPCVCLVCDYADCERVPFPLVFGKSFVLERRRLRNEKTLKG